MMKITDICGNTPLVKLQNILSHEHVEICIKLERMNAGGSIKDRPAKYIIEQAEKNGLLKPGGTIIEASSGNFGISCAMIGAAKGYKVIILVDPKVTPANYALLKAYGAEVIIVREKDPNGSYHRMRLAYANKLQQENPHSFRPDQFFSLENSNAHYHQTAPELFAQCNKKIDVLILMTGTGGQVGGFSRFFHEHSPNTKIIAIEPVGSSIFGGAEHPYLLPGVGLSWTPNNIPHLEYLDSIYKVPDEDAFLMTRLLARHEGILIGGSTGASLMVALKLSQTMDKNRRIVCMAADSGERYLDTIFNDHWLQENNLQAECSIEELYARANSLVPFSNDPIQAANYKPEIQAEISAICRTLT